MEKNIKWLKNNAYPGRGIVMGFGPNGERVQIFWIMGRSENSKNRIFVQNEDGSVSTKAFDEAKLTDPSLIIYDPFKIANGLHIISNGNQTDTIASFLKEGKTVEDAIKIRTYEHDAPSYTPRITGVFYPSGSYIISMVKSGDKELPRREAIFVERENGVENVGEMITTYERNEDPLPSFEGLPKVMPIKSTPEENLEYYWNLLNPEFRVSIMVNWIEPDGSNKIILENVNEHA